MQGCCYSASLAIRTSIIIWILVCLNSQKLVNFHEFHFNYKIVAILYCDLYLTTFFTWEAIRWKALHMCYLQYHMFNRMCYKIIGDHVHNRVDHVHNSVDHIYNRGIRCWHNLALRTEAAGDSSHNNKSSDKLTHKHTDTQTAHFVHLFVDLGMYLFLHYCRRRKTRQLFER